MKVMTAVVGVAGLASSALGGAVSGAGLVVLDHSANGALTMTGSSTVEVPTNAVYVNSTSSSAVKTTGNATLDTPNLYVAGGTSFTGNSGCTGTVHKGCVPYVNPMAGLAMPTAQGATDLGSVSVTGNSTVTLSPGYYSHGISVSGNSHVTFSPGVYMIKDELKISSGTVAGNGVCFVMLGGSLSISGSSSLTLTPPSSGDLTGVVMTQPSSNTSGMSLSGGSAVNIGGTIYVPGATLTLTGNSSLSGDGPQMGDLVVAKKVTLTGTGAVKIGHPSMPAIALPTMPLFD